MWGIPYTQSNKNKIEKIQRRADRWVENDYSSYGSVTQMLNILFGDLWNKSRANAYLILFYDKYSFSPHTVCLCLWNSLSVDVADAPSLVLFKRELSKVSF